MIEEEEEEEEVVSLLCLDWHRCQLRHGYSSAGMNVNGGLADYVGRNSNLPLDYETLHLHLH